MDDWFERIASGCSLAAAAARDLDDDGFAVIEGPVPTTRLRQMADAYDKAVQEASEPDLSVGRTTTRVHDFVNRGAEFDDLYVYPPVLAACCRTIGQPFKLSSMLARTLHPQSDAQGLHLDFARDQCGWPMVGFIVMIDEFRRENGATRFLPGSHRLSGSAQSKPVPDAELVPACGPPGSLIIYNGSVQHGHGPNETSLPRRSIQGAYIRRNAKPWVELASRMRAETTDRIGSLAKYLIAV